MEKVKKKIAPEVPTSPEISENPIEEQIQNHLAAAKRYETIAKNHRDAIKELQGGNKEGSESAHAPELHVLPPHYDPTDNQQHPAM
jgi:hypothetical protein